MQIMDLVPDLKPTILAARQVRDANNTLAKYMPYHQVEGVSYRLGRRRVVDQTVPIRGLDAPAVPITRPGVIDVRGDLPAIKVGGRGQWRVEKSEIEAYIQRMYERTEYQIKTGSIED